MTTAASIAKSMQKEGTYLQKKPFTTVKKIPDLPEDSACCGPYKKAV